MKIVKLERRMRKKFKETQKSEKRKEGNETRPKSKIYFIYFMRCPSNK